MKWLRPTSLRGALFAMAITVAVYLAAVATGLTIQLMPTARELAARGATVTRDFESRAQLARELDQVVTDMWRLLRSARVAPISVDTLRVHRAIIEQRALDVAFFEPMVRTSRATSDVRDLVGVADGQATSLTSVLLGVVASFEIHDVPGAERLLQRADSLGLPFSRTMDAITLAALQQVNADEQALVAYTERALRLVIVWSLVGVLLVVLLAIWTRDRLFRPLAKLDHGLSRIESGDLDVELPVRHQDELGRLMEHLNRTTAMLRRRREDDARHAADRTAARTRAIFESSLDPVIVFDHTGMIREWSPRAEVVFGWPRQDVIGRPYRDVLCAAGDAAHDAMRLASLPRDAARPELEMQRRDGSRLLVEVSVVPLVGETGLEEYGAFLHDVSGQRKLAEDLRQAQKLEAIGQLAGGVAHDFNNLLTGIIGYAELLKHDAGASDDVREDADAIRTTALRGADLARSLLTFARRTPQRDEPFDLVEVVREMVALARRTFDRRIEIETDLQLERAPMTGDASLISNALLNLAVNGRDAMPDGGTLRIRVRVAEHPVRLGPAPASGEHAPCVELTVEDTGEGMSDDVREHIFEPFFSTKEAGKGTGLGLAMVYGAVTAHHGHIDVTSRPEAGTIFTLQFPMRVQTFGRATPAFGVPVQGRGRVLLVDDEDLVRDVGVRMLRRLGYDVEEAPHGEAAVARLDRDAPGIDLVILDGNMPRMSGFEAAAIIHARHPALPLILVTGHLPRDAAASLAELGIGEVVQKPYSMRELSDVTARWIAVAR